MATQHAQDTISTVDFNLDGLPQDAFEAALDTIGQALVNAWAAGYSEGTKRRKPVQS